MIISGTRADYGIYKPVAEELRKRAWDVSFLVCGMHLSHKYGYSVQYIKADGFKISGTVDSLFLENSKANMAKSLSIELNYFTEVLKEEDPEFLLLLGDRGEMLAGAIAGAYLGIKTAHLHGGEVSGTIDESIRHAVSKLVNIHFTSTEKSSERLIRMGEDLWRIFTVGAPRIDTILNELLPEFSEVAKRYDLSIKPKEYLLLVYHPVVTETEKIREQIQEIVKSLKEIKQPIVCILPNADAGGELIRAEYEQINLENIHFVTNFSPEEYLTILQNCQMMIGNSSSGIIEAASFHVPVINIGTRQNGREQSANTINAEPLMESICQAFAKIESEDFQQKLLSEKNVYGKGNASKKIADILENLPKGNEWIQKKIRY